VDVSYVSILVTTVIKLLATNGTTEYDKTGMDVHVFLQIVCPFKHFIAYGA